MLANGAGRVYSFEPDPRKYAQLKSIYGDQSGVVVEQKAVTDRDGPVKLIRQGTHYSLVHQGTSDLTVEGVSLDSYFKDIEKIDFIKVDVEGGEFLVLRGAKETIGRNSQIRLAVEMHWTILAENKMVEKDMMDLIGGLGLQLVQGGGTWLLGRIPEVSKEETNDQEKPSPVPGE